MNPGGHSRLGRNQEKQSNANPIFLVSRNVVTQAQDRPSEEVCPQNGVRPVDSRGNGAMSLTASHGSRAELNNTQTRKGGVKLRSSKNLQEAILCEAQTIPTFEGISRCRSPREIGKMIRTLSAGSDSRELLEVARQRLRHMQGLRLHVVPPAPPIREGSPTVSRYETRTPKTEKTPTRLFNDSEINLSRISLNNSAIESIDGSKSTLNFSMSPSSVLQGVQFVEMPGSGTKSGGDEGSPPLHNIQTTRLRTIEESDDYWPSSNGDVDSLRGSKGQKMNAAAPTDNKLGSEDGSGGDSAIEDAERTIYDLKVEIAALTKRNKVLNELVDGIHKDRRAPDQSLQEEGAYPMHQEQVAAGVHGDLSFHQKVTDLKKKLEEASEKSRLVVGAERQLRQKQERQLRLRGMQNAHLSRILLETKKQVAEEKNKHANFVMKFLKVIGTKTTSTEREDMECEILNFAKAHVHLEERLRHITRQYKEAHAVNRQLDAKIHTLTHEVTSGQALIDKLLKTTHDTKPGEWEKKEEQYIASIRNYQQQIRKQASVVSLDLYKASVDEGRMTQERLKYAEKRIANLEERLEKKSMVRAESDKPAAFVSRSNADQLKDVAMSAVQRQANRRRGHAVECDGLPKSTMACDSRKQLGSRTATGKLNRGVNQDQYSLFNSPSLPQVNDLTGMTILCHRASNTASTPRNDQKACSKTDVGISSAIEGKQKKALEKLLSPRAENKENKTFIAQGSLRMQKARKFGGRKGLQLRLNKIRSPTSRNKSLY